MSETQNEAKGPPLGSWPRFYALTCAMAIAYVILLWWLTVAFNHPGGAA